MGSLAWKPTWGMDASDAAVVDEEELASDADEVTSEADDDLDRSALDQESASVAAAEASDAGVASVAAEFDLARLLAACPSQQPFAVVASLSLQLALAPFGLALLQLEQSALELWLLRGFLPASFGLQRWQAHPASLVQHAPSAAAHPHLDGHDRLGRDAGAPVRPVAAATLPCDE